MSDLARINDIIFACTTTATCIGMFGIGCSVDIKAIIKYLKSPAAYLIGVLTQILIVPLLAWALIEIFSVPFPTNLSVVIQGASPGGSTSNVVVYWMGGVIDLSVAMTGTTSLLSLGTMPFWLWVFSQTNNEDLVVPFDSVGITLASLIPPIVIGMVVYSKAPIRVSTIISKICIAIGSVGILTIAIVGTIVRNIVWVFTWQTIVVAILMPLIGFIVGYSLTSIPYFKLNHRVRRTVATEVALQNATVCSAVINGSFPIALIGKMVVFPLLYYIFQLAYSIFLIIFYRVMKFKGYFNEESEETENETNFKMDKDGNRKVSVNVIKGVNNEAFESENKVVIHQERL